MPFRRLLVLVLAVLLVPAIAPRAQPASDAPLNDAPVSEDDAAMADAPMTLERLGRLVLAIDADAETLADGRAWQFRVADIGVQLVTDPGHDRMRLMVPVAPAEALEPDLMMRLLQANFDSALDARYAVAQGVLWGTFIHPLSTLSDDEFLAGVGQTVNIVRTFGTTFSSGLVTFGGGDSNGLIERALIERALIDELLKRGEAI